MIFQVFGHLVYHDAEYGTIVSPNDVQIQCCYKFQLFFIIVGSVDRLHKFTLRTGMPCRVFFAYKFVFVNLRSASVISCQAHVHTQRAAAVKKDQFYVKNYSLALSIWAIDIFQDFWLSLDIFLNARGHPARSTCRQMKDCCTQWSSKTSRGARGRPRRRAAPQGAR